MKIKNMKLMLLGLLAMGASNASAAVGDVIKRANLVYVETTAATKTANAKVQFVGMVATPEKTDADGAIANQPDGTITIPATTWTMNSEGNKTLYDVTAIAPKWYVANGTYKTMDIGAKLTKLVSEVVEYDAKGLPTVSNLTAPAFAELTEVVLPTGQAVLADEAFFNCAKLATINLGNIEKFGDRCLNNTAITSIDLSKAKTIGAGAFGNVIHVTTVTIPSTVESIGDKAFAIMSGTVTVAGKPVKVGLESVTFNANDKITTLNATLFTGDDLIKNIKITSSKIKTIPANAFVSTVVETIDLTGCTELTTIDANAFATSTKLTSVKLAGTKVTDISNLVVSSSNQTLAEFTFPATLTNAGLPANYFQNNVAITEIDLSGTQVKQIPGGLFAYAEGTATEKLNDKGASFSPKQYYPSALTTVKLNAETTSIGANAFDGCKALATVTGLNQDKLTTINPFAFNGTGMTAVDLSAATNTAFVTIPKQAFGNMANLTTITLPAQITGIAQGAFLYDAAVTSINLEDLTKLTTLNDLFHANIATAGSVDDVPIALATVTLPEDGALTTISNGALQLLDIEEITIPATVTSFGSNVLQGCINLKKFTWEDAQVWSLNGTTFIGDDRLEEVRFMTLDYRTTLGSTSNDDIFQGNDKDVLKVYVNGEAYVRLRGLGWSEANLKYCTLVGEGESELEIKTKSGDYYWRTYRNKDNATWFKAEEVEVFTAVVEGSNVVMKAASTEGGYYKVAQYGSGTILIWANGQQQKNAVCIIRSKNPTVTCELKDASFNNISTLSEDNALQVAIADFTPSRLKYQYKFGVKDGVLAFWRVTSGTIKKDGIFIDSAVKKDRLDIVFDGDATAIQSILNESEDNNAPIYNLNGVRVNKAGKGVYIQNGKKYVK